MLLIAPTNCPILVVLSSLKDLQIEELAQLLHSLVGILHRVADGSRVVVDLPIIAPLEGFVTEEMDSLVVDARDILLIFDMLQAVPLVPSLWKDVKRDLATNGVPKTLVSCKMYDGLWSLRTLVQYRGIPS